MNERNVAALRDILNEYGAHAYTYDKAEWLAMNGVLVPEVLTSDDILRLTDGWSPSVEPDDVRVNGEHEFRRDLERIAKGEPAR